MIDLYTWSTPNGRKVSIMLEELGLAYRVHPVDITQGEQFAPDFVAVSPNNKIPAIVDQDNGQTLMESGAILLYLGERHGRFLPADGVARWRTIEWLMWQMGGAGPMLGQAHHFVHFNPDKSEYARERYRGEAERLYGVLDRRLGEHAFLAGDDYSVADIATWPWIARYEWQGVDFAAYPHVLRWYRAIAARPAVQRGFVVPNEAPIPQPAGNDAAG
ncbi:MAG: glutathione S-transferase N-terminal domain-containing protein [Gammaproteobacteria bacterium]|nr:glutathione S-transferase N-terminal domain-containing protein [Gammaproteobacteria bacterium]